MGKSQRTKGATGEREVAAIFSLRLNRVFKRNIGQARDGGNDLDVGPLVVEVKRRKTLTTLYNWYQQAKAAADRRAVGGDQHPPIPIVVARGDNGQWLAVLPLDHFLDLTEDELLFTIQDMEQAAAMAGASVPWAMVAAGRDD